MISRLRKYILNENTYLSFLGFIIYYTFKIGPKISIKMAIDYRWFDLWYKTDTSITETSDIDYVVNIKTVNIKHAVGQTGDKLTRFSKVMSVIKKNLSHEFPSIFDLSFIDYGCGKGRVLMLAKKYGFKEVAGVELSSSMIDVEKNNFKIINEPSIRITEEDAVEYNVPYSDGYIFYFYNPFVQM